MPLPPRHELLPFVTVLKCTKNFPKPAEYRGEWPRRRRSYVVDLFTPAGESEPRVYVQGLVTKEPDSSFPFANWQFVATIWLN